MQFNLTSVNLDMNLYPLCIYNIQAKRHCADDSKSFQIETWVIIHSGKKRNKNYNMYFNYDITSCRVAR